MQQVRIRVLELDVHREVIHDLDDSVQLPWLEERNVTVVRGFGRLAGERRVEVDGSRVVLDERRRYWLLNKPAGVVSTAADPEGRPIVVGMVPEQPRVFPVGHLDRDT